MLGSNTGEVGRDQARQPGLRCLTRNRSALGDTPARSLRIANGPRVSVSRGIGFERRPAEDSAGRDKRRGRPLALKVGG